MKNFCEYLNIGAQEENWGLYVNTVGYSKVGPHQHYPKNEEHPKNHSFEWNKGRILSGYYLVFISKGQGMFESSFTNQTTVSEGTCFFLYPGVWHRYKPNSNSGWEEYWVGFNGAYPHQLMHKSFFTETRPFINVGLHCELLNLFHNIIETVRGCSSGYHQVIAGITLQILGVLNAASMHKEQQEDSIEGLITKAKFLLQESLDKPVDMELLARNLPMGYSAFRKAFKKATGEPPNQYHLNLRLNKAMHLLSSTTLSISEVAYQTGFDSLFYFSKLFKQKTQKSPKIYRSEIITPAYDTVHIDC